MPGMATAEQLDELAAAPELADELFVELMSAHHQGGIDMATEAAERADNDDVRRFASSWARISSPRSSSWKALLADTADATRLSRS